MQFIISGKPIPLKRARSFKRGDTIGHYNSQKKHMQAVYYSIQSQLPTDYKPPTDPLHLIVSFHMPFPASYPKKKREALAGDYHTLKPDLSNLVKFYEDALNGLLWVDDQQIARITTRKIWDYEGKTVIKVQPIEVFNE